jgi:hypothetical protein
MPLPVPLIFRFAYGPTMGLFPLRVNAIPFYPGLSSISSSDERGSRVKTVADVRATGT